MKTKKIAILTCCVLLLVGVIGATLAWLTDQTQEIKNTFTVGNIDITLTETGATDSDDEDTLVDNNSYKMIPGFTITKDPKVTVTAESEDCFLFVKLDKSANFDAFMTYAMADGWTAGDGANLDENGNPPEGMNGVPVGVYFRIVKHNDGNKEFNVIKDNTVTVKDTVTKADMDTLKTASLPTLTVKSYAVQLYKTNEVEFTAAEAWAKVTP